MTRLLALAVVLAAAGAMAPGAHAASISGTAFRDTNRDGTQQAGEASLAAQGVVLFDAGGQTQLAFRGTDASGRYSFSGLAPGNYRVQYDATSWWELRQDWAPTTTGGVFPRIDVALNTTASADFGWRPIVRSTEALGPISTYTGPQGLRVDSYDDVVPAREVYDHLTSGTLVGAEAGAVTVHFDDGPSPVCTTSVSGSEGSYAGYHADVYVPYLSWLSQGDGTLFHEYGHAWSLYVAFMLHQSTNLDSYLTARGLLGDPRLDTTHAWGPRELIAEDYRQLFGTASAQALPQENTELPAAGAVPGLREFLSATFPQPLTPPAPAPAPEPSPSPSPPAPAAPVTLSAVAMSPAPVKSTGSASFALSAGASVTVTIRDGKGTVVRTLLRDAAEPKGSSSASWDRKNAAGQRVKSGTYSLKVDAVDAAGSLASASASFKVS